MLQRLRTPSARGFTLIELMMAVAVIAILASIAIPSYSQYALRAKRSEGRAALLEAAARMERYYTDNQSYPSNISKAGIPSQSENGYYKLSGTAKGNNFSLEAQADGFTDADCGVLGIDQAGRRTIIGSGTVSECWRR